MSKYQSAQDVFDSIKQGKRSGYHTYRIAKNFTWAEVFGSMQGEEWDEITLEMLENAVKKAWWLQAQRDRFGPIRVTSWLRPETYNRRVGGAPQSKHKRGYAVDWIPIFTSISEAFRLLKLGGFEGGLAMRTGQFIHTDLRGYRDTWSY